MARLIKELQGAFLLFEITRGDAKRKKVALQEVCALYRRGMVLSWQQVESIERAINGIVLQDGQDLKVVRWCLNALAQFGRRTTCQTYVETALIKYPGDPEIQASGVAALCRLFRGSVVDIAALQHIDPVIWKLAALQNTEPSKIELGSLSIDIYSAKAPVLRLALITVGLNKDIEHLFHPNHSNAAFVRHLAQHDDIIVQQYSVWSVIENHRLDLRDLGIPVDKIEDTEPNVQSKLYQLVAEKDPDARRRLEVTAQGSMSGTQAREGLSKGVKRHYYDGLEEVVIPWMEQETHRPVRELLAEHIAAFADECGPYEDLAFNLYETEPRLRERLLLGAEGTPLYGKLKAVGPRDLLEGVDAGYDVVAALRYSSSKERPNQTVLMLAASPLDLDPQLRLGAEYREVLDRVERIKRPKVILNFSWQPAVRPADIITHLLNAEAVIVHFSGHGTKRELIFEDEAGNASYVDADALVSALTGKSGCPKCVVLNACDSSHLAEKMAPHVDVVIGCNAPIGDDAAIIFSSGFYQAIATGRGYQDSFNIGLASLKTAGYGADSAKYRIWTR
jgi:CHAT domain